MAHIMIGMVLLFLLTCSSYSEAAGSSGHMRDTSQRLYDRIMEEFKHRDYEAALAGFRLFIELHSQSSLAANAQYWIGECQLRMRRYHDALDSFYAVLISYPFSSKLSASLLKLGHIYVKLGDHEKARLMFERVIDHYPDSSEAKQAHKALRAVGNGDVDLHEAD